MTKGNLIKRNNKFKLILLVFVILVTIGSFLLFQKPEKEFTSKISIELTGENTKDIASPAEVQLILGAEAELLDKESKTITDAHMILNEKTQIAELKEGGYKLHLIAVPIEVDGSTYKLPETTIDFKVEKGYTEAIDGKTFKITYKDDEIIINVELERLPVEDMTKEQLQAVITHIETEAPDKYKDLVNDLNKRAETAKSDPESAKDVTQPSESTGKSDVEPTPEKPKPTESAPEPTKPAPTPEPTKPAHVHDYQPVYKHHPATPEQGHTVNHPSEGYNRTKFVCSDGAVFYDSKEAQNGCSIQTFQEWVETKAAWTEYVVDVPAKAAWDELIGYQCAADGEWK